MNYLLMYLNDDIFQRKCLHKEGFASTDSCRVLATTIGNNFNKLDEAKIAQALHYE